MTPAAVQVFAIVAPLVGVVLGGTLSWIGQSWRERKDRKLAIGKALADLLEVRHQLFTIDIGLERVRKRVEITPEQARAVRTVTDILFKPAPELAQRYDDAVSTLAGLDPTLAFWLRSKNLLPKILGEWRQLGVTMDADANTIEPIEAEMRGAVKAQINDAVIELAKLHSASTHRRVKDLVSKEEEWPPELELLLTRIFGGPKSSERSS